ncbi:MAG: peptide ABC transporter substrate-binding protein [Candidatus Eremiobacteraeota bacterium]|nr:peptide ABC transporter substrate-binding protein [Candidatus Eremiobacteraeota bacterium]
MTAGTLAALCIFAAACTKVSTGPAGQTSGRHSWTRAGELRIAIQAPPNTLNPLLASNTTESMMTRLTNDVLVSVDASGRQEVPVLAAEVPTLENGGISRDGLTITYKLRHNVVWHDGVPFSSKDVKFTWTAIMNPRNNVISRTGYELVRSVDTPDPFTVVFHMKQRFSPAVNTLFGESDSPYTIVPEHLLARYPNINSVSYNTNPVGTGPFKLKTWARGDHLEYEPNPRYFLGVPKLQRIIVKIVPDENTSLNQLRTHETDFQYQASPQEYPQVKTLPNLRVVLNQMNQIERLQLNNARFPLTDVHLRQAMAYAIDKERLVNELTFGSAVAADQDLPPFMWAHAQNITRYPYDPPRARTILRADGWTPGPDGVLQKAGHRLSLEIVYNTSNATRRRGVVLVQAMLRQVGIETQVKSYIASLLFAPYGMGGILQTGKFDVSFAGWVAGIDPDNSSEFMCSARPPNGNNTDFYCSAAMDAAQKQALENFDIPTRKRAYDTIEALLTSQEVEIPLWWPRQIEPVNPDFMGFTPNPVTESWNSYQWAI